PIFSGYAAEAASVRLKDAGAKLLAVQDGFLRRGRGFNLSLKSLVNCVKSGNIIKATIPISHGNLATISCPLLTV
ncbi:MAG: hypothetical protein QXH34_00765, partial [Ignisphaera sp.]